eukprot:365313-Chlamydomonas_euryale.AAC.10
MPVSAYPEHVKHASVLMLPCARQPKQSRDAPIGSIAAHCAHAAGSLPSCKAKGHNNNVKPTKIKNLAVYNGPCSLCQFGTTTCHRAACHVQCFSVACILETRQTPLGASRAPYSAGASVWMQSAALLPACMFSCIALPCDKTWRHVPMQHELGGDARVHEWTRLGSGWVCLLASLNAPQCSPPL